MAVWAVYIYLFFEYVRPQAIYPVLDVLPFALLALATATVTAVLQTLRERRWNLLDSGMLAFTAVLLLSVLFAFSRDVSNRFIGVYFSWVAVYVALSSAINTLTRVHLMLAGWLLWNFKMSFFAFRSWAAIGFGFRDWGVVGAPGWFENSGEFGIQMCVIFPISLYFALGVRPHVSKPVFLALLALPFTALAGATASSSRGALLGMAVIGLWILVRSRHRVRGLIALAVIGTALYAALPEEQKARLADSGSDDTSISRLTYWGRGLEIAKEHPVFGIGYANWTVYNNVTYVSDDPRRPRLGLPHNIFIEAVAELGYTGLLSLVFLLAANFVVNAKTRRLARTLGAPGRYAQHLAWGFDGAIVGYVASGFFVTVLYYPYQWVNFAMSAALYLAVRRAATAARRMAAMSGTPLGARA